MQPHSFVAPSASDGLNISTTPKAPLQSRSRNSKPSSKKTSRILRPLSTTSRVNLEGTLSINWKKPETGHHTSSISNPSWRNLIVSGPQMNWPWSAIFGKVLNPLLRSKWNSKTERQLVLKRWCREQLTQKPKQA